jgi:SAM-dependent methyltransferase
MTELDFPAGSFDAICSFYAIIHVPRGHRPLLLNFHRMLKPGGLLLLCMGAVDWPGEVEEFYGAPMYWSHFDAETNLRMVREAGFALIWSRMIADILDPEIPSAHLFMLAQRRVTA